MKTFLSILSVKTNSYSNEKIVLGLIAVTANEVFYAYSKTKLALLNKFSKEEDIAFFLKSLLNQVQHTVEESNKTLTSNQSSLIHGVTVFSEDYFSYLSKYNNGIFQFSEPVIINTNFSANDFANYYGKFVGESLTIKSPKPKKTFYQKLKPLFEKDSLKQKADINFQFNPVTFKGILKETNIPLITKNGDISALQTIDFTLQPNTIANHFYETQIILNALTIFSKKIGCNVEKIKIGFEEPELKTEQHKLFNMAFSEYKNVFEFLTIDKVEKYTDKIAESENVKFSSLLNK